MLEDRCPRCGWQSNHVVLTPENAARIRAAIDSAEGAWVSVQSAIDAYSKAYTTLAESCSEATCDDGWRIRGAARFDVEQVPGFDAARAVVDQIEKEDRERAALTLVGQVVAGGAPCTRAEGR